MLARRTFLTTGASALLLAGCGNAQTAGSADGLTQATLRRVVRMRFDAPPAEIQPQLLTKVDTYDPTISEVRFDHSRSSIPGEMGVGSVRICVFEDGRELHEPLLFYDPPRAYAYTVDQDASTMSLPVSEIVLAYEFADNDAGGADLTVRVFFDPRIPGTGPVITPVLTGTVRRTFQAAVSVFGGEYLGDERP